MKRFILVPLLAALALPLSVLLAPDDAEAIPAFARQTKQKCTYCHVAFPKLNEFGITFKNNGYRLQGTKGTDVWDIPAWPVAALAEIEVEWDDFDKDERGEDSLTIMQPEVEVFWGTTLGPRISTFGEIILERGEGADLGPVFIQYNDLVGEAQLNLRAGAYDVDFSFLSPARSIVFDGYAAEDLGFFGTAVGLEANGQILPEDEGLTVRYALGYTLDNDAGAPGNESDLSESVYGTVELTFMEQTLGAHYQHHAGDEADIDRWSIAAELHGAGAILTLAWFDATLDGPSGGDDLEGDDILVELLYPVGDFVVGARWDKLSDDGFTGDGDFEQWTLHASWYTRPNVQLGAELRFLDFEESSSGADDEDEAIKGRLIARFGF